MTLSSAERTRRCQEEKKAAGLHTLTKQRDRERKRLVRSRMSSTELKVFRLRQQANLRKFRSKSTPNPTRPSLLTSSFSTKHSKVKALKRLLNALPVNND